MTERTIRRAATELVGAQDDTAGDAGEVPHIEEEFCDRVRED